MIDKADLRRVLLASRNALPEAQRRHADALIGARLIEWYRAHPVTALGVYWPIRTEPNLQETYLTLFNMGARLALPVVVARNAPLQFVQWQPGDAMTTDAMGIAIPAEPHCIMQPDALLVPCVGYNQHKIRLGYGGGFYDRTLACAPRPLAIGIAYTNAMADFEGASHDIALDFIITDTDLVT